MKRDADQGEARHDRDDRVALLLAADHPAERARQREADDQQQEDLEPVRPRGRVLERVRGVGVVEATAVGAEFLDGLLAGHGAAGDGLLAAGEGVDDLVVQVEVLDRAAGDQDDRADDRDRQQDAQRCRAPGRPRSCPDRRCACARTRGPGRSRPPCRPRRTRSSARPDRPSAPGGPGSTHPSTPASWCW